jgi:eukaryotic-like serine/threonine-protein kinase
VETALEYARQIAAALEAAHDKGIIHRDLKPANIKVTADGLVRLLDFGLAKATDETTASAPGQSPTLSPTISLAMTQAGMILGTAAYMSPEQARGKLADKRADIWAFGVVLYEMLTGERLFGGETASDILAGVLKLEPNISKAPREVRRLLERCLEKDPKKRLRDIGDAMPLVEEPAAALTPAPARRQWLPSAVAALLLALAASLAFVRLRESAPETPVIRTLIEPPPNTAFFTSAPMGMIAPPAFSPDGRRMVFGIREQDGKTRLWVRALDSVSAAEPGTRRA